MQLNIQKLNGHWNEGFALDLHTVSAEPIEMDEKGKVTKWETTYTEIGEHLYKLKYWHEQDRAITIAEEAASFLKSKEHWKIHKFIPVPASDTKRKFQPVYEIAMVTGHLLKLEVDNRTLKKVKSTSQLKDIEDADKRKEILKDAFDIESNIFEGKNILLLDDLFRSGETLNAVYDIVKNKGNAANVYVLTITKTRSKK